MTVFRRVVLLAAVVGALSFGVANASADGADTINTCFGPAVFFNTFGYWTTNYCFTEVQTPSGNASVSFHADVAPPSTAPSKALTIRGFDCFTTFGLTTDTRVVITPSGEVNGTCKYQP